MENMMLPDCRFENMLPMWMREDSANKSIAEAVNIMVTEYVKKIESLKKWTNIDEMQEEFLDQMAWELNISWYRYDANVVQKRHIIKNAKKIHQKLGTKWAMEQVLSIYFDESTVLEWWQYGGEPGHFKIQTFNTATVNRDAECFLTVLNDVKRYSQVLDNIEIISKSSMEIKYVIKSHISERIVTTVKG